MSSVGEPKRPLAALAAQKTNRVVLTGFMGSGKTTVGRMLAEALGWTFVDLDQEIERREGRSVPAIFEKYGEVGFRRVESIVLAGLLGQRQTVLALGGGAPETLSNKLLMEQTPGTAIVHLAAPFTILVERCRDQQNATGRPLLADLGSAKDRYEKRQRIYERVANHTIETSQLSLEQTVDAILVSLRSLR